MPHHYGPENPHPYDDPNKQRNNPDFPAYSYPIADGMVDPVAYETNPSSGGERQYHIDRITAAIHRHQENLRQASYNDESSRKFETSEVPVSWEANLGILFPVTVNYDLSLDDLVEEGNYDEAALLKERDSLIFPERRGAEDIQIEIIQFGFILPIKDTLGVINRAGFDPVNVIQLLAFDAQNPDVQRRFQIAGFCSNDRLPFLGVDGFGRRGVWVTRDTPKACWSNDQRFAVLRKSNKGA